MARLSDVIEEFIKEMFEETAQDEILIQRNELANIFHCAPSQINYVLTTRFTSTKGYYIESRRGGGGCIKITKINISEDDYIKGVILKNIGEKVSQREAFQYIDIFKDEGLINSREENIMKYAVSDNTLSVISSKDYVRSNILKAMLISVLN
ncbi:CtsR family transcriptional regulator [Clostridium cylindrosporum]|uniref:Transcriptional regulator CtsR n=1 Tax=Clostridium cylindrosporum DSM 605 TaxID=1121307 RepID=A0A0J8G409_CLOCY|nr:CtsR family transcriptional regulator [Clostridium cylindrosporum]KMT22436.1 transcriptional regulator CtsR [Clostridium cylindrosporum DSM 605]